MKFKKIRKVSKSCPEAYFLTYVLLSRRFCTFSLLSFAYILLGSDALENALVYFPKANFSKIFFTFAWQSHVSERFWKVFAKPFARPLQFLSPLLEIWQYLLERVMCAPLLI